MSSMQSTADTATTAVGGMVESSSSNPSSLSSSSPGAMVPLFDFFIKRWLDDTHNTLSPASIQINWLERTVKEITKCMGRFGLKNKWLSEQVRRMIHYANDVDPIYVAWFLFSAAAVHVNFKSHYFDLLNHPLTLWDAYIANKLEVVLDPNKQSSGPASRKLYYALKSFLTDKTKNRMNRYYTYLTKKSSLHAIDSGSDAVLTDDDAEIILYYFNYECEGYPLTTVYFTLFTKKQTPLRRDELSDGGGTPSLQNFEEITLTVYNCKKDFFQALFHEVLTGMDKKDKEEDCVWYYTFNFYPPESSRGPHLGPPQIDVVTKKRKYGEWGKQRKSPKDNLILNYKVVDRLDASVTEFLGSKADYKSSQIPYRKGFLLYGPPGTGKTSIIRYLATIHKLNLCEIPLSSDQCNSDNLASIIHSAPKNSILLMDDVDLAGVSLSPAPSGGVDNGRGRGGGMGGGGGGGGGASVEKKEKITLQVLLNVLDGADAYEDNLLFMTTNRKEMLSKTLIRDGRIDVKEEIPLASWDQIYRYFIQFFPEETALAAEFCQKLPEFSVPMVTLEKHFQKYTNYSIRKEKELMLKIDKPDTQCLIVSKLSGFFGEDEKLERVPYTPQFIEKMDKSPDDESAISNLNTSNSNSSSIVINGINEVSVTSPPVKPLRPGDRIYFIHDVHNDGTVLKRYPGFIKKVYETKDGYEFDICISRYNLNGVYERIETSNSNLFLGVSCTQFRKRSNEAVVLEKGFDGSLSISINGMQIIKKSMEDTTTSGSDNNDSSNYKKNVTNSLSASCNATCKEKGIIRQVGEAIMFPLYTLSDMLKNRSGDNKNAAGKSKDEVYGKDREGDSSWRFTKEAKEFQRSINEDTNIEDLLDEKKDLSNICVTCYLAQQCVKEVSNIYVEIKNDNLKDCSMADFLSTLALEQYAPLFAHFEVNLGRNFPEAQFDQLVKANLTLQYDYNALIRFKKLRNNEYFDFQTEDMGFHSRFMFSSRENPMETTQREEIRSQFFKAYPPPSNTLNLPDSRVNDEFTHHTPEPKGVFQTKQNWEIDTSTSPRGGKGGGSSFSRQNSLKEPSTPGSSLSSLPILPSLPVPPSADKAIGRGFYDQDNANLVQDGGIKRGGGSQTVSSASYVSSSRLSSDIGKGKRYKSLIYPESISYEASNVALEELFKAVSSQDGIIKLSRYNLEELLLSHPKRPLECVKAAYKFVNAPRKMITTEDSDIDLATFLKRAGHLHALEALKKHFKSAMEMRVILTKFRQETDFNDIVHLDRFERMMMFRGNSPHGNHDSGIGSRDGQNNQGQSTVAAVADAIYNQDQVKFECLQNYPDLIEILTRKPLPHLKLKDFSLFSVSQVIEKFKTFYARLIEIDQDQLATIGEESSSPSPSAASVGDGVDTESEKIVKFPLADVEAAAYTFAKRISDHKLVSRVSLIEIKNHLEKYRSNPIDACKNYEEILSVPRESTRVGESEISHNYVSADGIEKYFLALRSNLGKKIGFDAKKTDELNENITKASYFYRTLGDCFYNIGISPYDLLRRGGVECYAPILDHRNVTSVDDLARFASVDCGKASQISNLSKRIITLLLSISARLRIFDVNSGKALGKLFSLDAYGQFDKREFSYLDCDEIKSDFESFYKDYVSDRIKGSKSPVAATSSSSSSSSCSSSSEKTENDIIHNKEEFTRAELANLAEELSSLASSQEPSTATNGFKCVSRYVFTKLMERHPRRPRRCKDAAAMLSSSAGVCESFLEICDMDIETFINKVYSGDDKNQIIDTLKANYTKLSDQKSAMLGYLSELDKYLNSNSAAIADCSNSSSSLVPPAPSFLPFPLGGGGGGGGRGSGRGRGGAGRGGRWGRGDTGGGDNSDFDSSSGDSTTVSPNSLPTPAAPATANVDVNALFENIPVEVAQIIKDIVVNSDNHLDKLYFKTFANVDASKVRLEFMKFYADLGYIRKPSEDSDSKRRFKAWLIDKILPKINLAKYSDDLVAYLANFAIYSFDHLIGRSKVSLKTEGLDSSLVDILCDSIKEGSGRLGDIMAAPNTDNKARERLEQELEAIAYSFSCAVSDENGWSRLNTIQIHNLLDRHKGKPLEALLAVKQFIAETEKLSSN